MYRGLVDPPCVVVEDARRGPNCIDQVRVLLDEADGRAVQSARRQSGVGDLERRPGEQFGGNAPVEVVPFQAQKPQVGKSSQFGGYASYQGISGEGQPLQIDELSQLGRYLARQLVPLQVQIRQILQVTQFRRYLADEVSTT